MSERVMLFEPGDRVGIKRGPMTGKAGEVVELCGDLVKVKGASGRVVALKFRDLVRLDASDDFPNGGKPDDPVNQSESPESESEALARLVDAEVDKTPTIPHLQKNGSPSRTTADPNGLQQTSRGYTDLEGLQADLNDLHSPSGTTQTFRDYTDLEGLQMAIAAIEQECTRLRTISLTDCWLKSWKRGSSQYYRLHYTAASGRKPDYVSGEDVAVIQERINNGRKLKTLQAAIVILRELAK